MSGLARVAEAEWGRLDAGAVGDVPVPGGAATESPWDTQVWTAPGPVAEAFYWSDAKVCALRGPVGSGKTKTNMRKPARRALMMPRSTIDGVRRYKAVISRQTYRQLWNTTIPSYLSVFPRAMGLWAGGRGDPVTHSLTLRDEHGAVEFVAEFLAFGEGPAEIEANMRGVETTDLFIEEADTVPLILLTTGIGRITRWPSKEHFQGGAFWPQPYPEAQTKYGQINMTYNAPEEGNWLAKMETGEDAVEETDRALMDELAKAKIDIRFFRQPGAFEPGAENLANLASDYYASQLGVMRATGRGDQIERLLHNQIGFVRKGDLVFGKHFSRHLHVSREPLELHPHFPIRIGLDQGFFGAAVIVQLLPPYQWRVLAELSFKARTFASDFGLALRELLDTRFDGVAIEGAWGDMAGEAGNAAAQENATWNEAVSRAAGIDIEPQTHGGNRIEPRLAAIRAALDHVRQGQPGLLIDPSCGLLIRGFAADYVWADEVDRAGNRTTKPRKAGNRSADAMDALGYVMLSEQDGSGLARITRMARGRAEAEREEAAGPQWSTAWSPFGRQA